MPMHTKMNPESTRNTFLPSLARAHKLAVGLVLTLAGCASATFNPNAFVPGQSTVADVEAHAGKPAAVQAGARGAAAGAAGAAGAGGGGRANRCAVPAGCPGAARAMRCARAPMAA